MDYEGASLEMAQWRESLDQMLAMVESIKRNIERNSWDGRIRNLLNYIEQLDCEATIETKALEKMQRQKQGSNSVTDAARDSFRKWAEEINREQLNKRGEAADRIENLRNVDRGDTSSAIEVEKIYYSKKDPYTKQDIKDPVQNMSCLTSGLYFIPAFFGIQTPLNDDSACCGFLGIRPDTTKEQMVRAILESIAFRIYQIWRTVRDEIGTCSPGFVRCCGGVSTNDFICQTISTLTRLPLQRISRPSFASACGIAMMAGITCDLWNKDDLDDLIDIERIFLPELSIRKKLLQDFKKWEMAMQRCLRFYDA
ncbi:putative glycerol kinase [Dirofilaria immitis]